MWPSCVPMLLGRRGQLTPRFFLLLLTLGLLGSLSPTFAHAPEEEAPATTVPPARQWTTSTYDALGRVTRTTQPDGSQTLACYDDWVTVEIDANQHQTRTTDRKSVV